LAVAGALIFTGPWIVRNARAFGEFIPTSTNGGVNFYLGTVGVDYSEPPLFKRLPPTDAMHPKARENHYYRLGLENVQDHPLRWLGFAARRIYTLYGEESEFLIWGELEQHPAIRVVASGYWLAVLPLALVGLGTVAVERRRLPRAWSYLAGSIALVTILKLAYMALPRHRLPLTYLLIVLAGLGAQRLLAARASRGGA
jgi:hypothetical protein